MVASVALSSEAPSIAVLFAPRAVVIIDIFRALGDFEDRYDVCALDALEDDLARAMTRDMAKGVVSDALLLAFGLRRERREAMDYATCGSRRGTGDEMALMALLGAVCRHDDALASKAAAALGLMHPQPLVALALDIASRLEAAGLTLDAPDPRLFREPRRDTGITAETKAPPAALRKVDL